jgi:hypothetical protein
MNAITERHLARYGAAINQVLTNNPESSTYSRRELASFVGSKIGASANVIATIWGLGEGKYWHSINSLKKTQTGHTAVTNTFPTNFQSAVLNSGPTPESVKLMHVLNRSEHMHRELMKSATESIDKITSEFREILDQQNRDHARVMSDLSVKEIELKKAHEILIDSYHTRTNILNQRIDDERKKNRDILSELAAAKVMLANTPSYEFVEVKLRRISDRVQTLSGNYASMETDAFDSNAMGIKPGCVLKIVREN